MPVPHQRATWWALWVEGSTGPVPVEASSASAAVQQLGSQGQTVVHVNKKSYATSAEAQNAVRDDVGAGLSATAPWWVIKNSAWLFTQGAVSSALGVSGEYIVEQSAAKPTGVTVAAGPFATQAEAQAWANAHNPSISNPLSGLEAVGGFFNQLGQANTWIRVGEVLLGIILIGIGLARITGAQNVVSQVVKARIP